MTILHVVHIISLFNILGKYVRLDCTANRMNKSPVSIILVTVRHYVTILGEYFMAYGDPGGRAV